MIVLKALLVDDEVNNLENLEFLLHHDCEGIEVVGKAQNAGQARLWLQSHTADVVFLDINMPGETGFGLLNSRPARNLKWFSQSGLREYMAFLFAALPLTEVKSTCIL